ncbi:MAG: ATP-binding cassette domain-containing protein [Clostridiaceae bacterium]|nr:ATP-binding cassette domain-containing protein [Clostridiaceae bacterium]
MIEINNLVKYYGDNKAVDDITFRVEEGEILGFLGPNGAGKTTTMNILTGYISATSGVVKVNGYDILEEPAEARSHIGYLPEHPPLYLDMTVLEYLRFVCNLKGVPKHDQAEHLSIIMKRVWITDVMDRLIGNLSKGYRQRVGLAQALVGRPAVLVLDEPTNGLDPRQIIDVRNLIKELGKSHTIILSSHILPEVSAVCDRAIIINRGKIVNVGPVSSLSGYTETAEDIEIAVDAPARQALPKLRQIDGVKNVTQMPAKPGTTVAFFHIEAVEGRDVRRAVFYEMSRMAWPILAMRSVEPTLEDIFLRVTGGAPASPDDIATAQNANIGNA